VHATVAIGDHKREIEHTFPPGELDPLLVQHIAAVDSVWDRRLDEVVISLEVHQLSWPFDGSGAGSANLEPALGRMPEAGEPVPPLIQMETAVNQDWPEQLELKKYAAPSSVAAILDNVRADLDSIQSKSIRRVDWVLANATTLLREHSAGDVIRSSEFSLAGVRGLRLHFYPRGRGTGQGEPAGRCAVFVTAPEGSSMKFQLAVGKKIHTFEQTFADTDLVGMRGFCDPNEEINELDELCVALTVFAASLEVQHPVETMSHPANSKVVQVLKARKHEPPILFETRRIILNGLRGPRVAKDEVPELFDEPLDGAAGRLRRSAPALRGPQERSASAPRNRRSNKDFA
jgi:hypothetical protein